MFVIQLMFFCNLLQFSALFTILVLTAANAKHSGRQTSEMLPTANSTANESALSTHRRNNVEPGTIPGFLDGQASGKSSLRWDDCNATNDFICQKSETTSTTSSPQYLRGNPKISLRTTFVTLAEFINAFTTQSHDLFNLVRPAITALVDYPNFTPAQKIEITTTNATWYNFVFVVMPDINLLVATSSVLSPGQMQQIYTAATDGLTLSNHIQALANSYPAQSTPNFIPLLPILNVIREESVTFYNILANITINPLVQPSITTEQAQILNHLYGRVQSLYFEAVISKNIFLATSTAVATKTAVTPIPPLAQIIQTIVTATEDLYSVLFPFVSVADPSTLRTSEVAQIHAIFSQVPNFISAVLPNIVTTLSTNPILTPAQVQQLKDAIDQGIMYHTSGQCLSSAIAAYLTLIPVQSQAFFDGMNQGLAMSIGIQEVLSHASNLPTISPAQLLQLQTLLGSYQSAITAMKNTLTTTTTTTVTTPTTTTSATTTHVLTQAERNTIIGQIQGLIAQILALLLQLGSPAVTLRTTAVQREQPEEIINKLLTLRSRQAEIEMLVSTMSAHAQTTITTKLDASRDRLRNMVSDPTSFTQNLKFLPGNVQPLTQLLKQMVNILQPFF